jgi:hypothetical protein
MESVRHTLVRAIAIDLSELRLLGEYWTMNERLALVKGSGEMSVEEKEAGGRWGASRAGSCPLP